MSALTIRLQRQDNSPWGFRLQGGKDFGQPLLIQKVNGGSIAERAGLQVGDALIRVNGVEVAESRHKEAQDTIIKGGNSLELAVQRMVYFGKRGGQNTWRPQVSPVGQVPLPGKASPATTVTRTSLAATGKSPAPIGAGHNLSPKPFGTTLQMNGEPGVKALVNKQYNTPVNIYSEDVIAETLSAQAEVIAGGAIGVNFKKNEKTYDATKSEVLKMVQEVEKEPKEPDTPDGAGTGVIGSSSSSIGFGGLRHVQPPEPRPTPASPQPQQLPPGQNICADCERLIVGVFVRIKDKNLHVECFKCATCGTSLKNVGYYNINNKLYCDIHAKMVARQNPPAANLEPVTVPPGGRAPLGAFTSPLSSSAPAPGSPQPGTLAPLPFHAPRTTTSHVTTPWYGRQTSAPSGPKPFSSVTAPCPPPASVSFTPAPAPPPAPQLQQHVAPPTPFSSVSQPTSFSKPSGFSSSKPNTNLSRVHDSVVNQISDTLTKEASYPICNKCQVQIKRGPFITALGKIWCPEHFVCVNAKCRRPLQDIGFVEEQDGLYCEFCFEQYLAPVCDKCRSKIKGDCLNAIGKHFHPECFACAYCGKLFGNNPFFLEDALPYCENDWNELFTTKCFSCGFPIEAGDRWVEALNNNYHSQCFNCTMCKKNLEGQSFFAKAGRPFCKNHAR